MADLLIKYVVVLDDSKTWLQMADKIEDLSINTPNPCHIERWFYSRHDKGDSLMFQEKWGDKLPFFLKWLNLPALPPDDCWLKDAEDKVNENTIDA
jgi:hypothetical protein